MPHIFSAKIDAGQGYSAPAEIVNITGWTVYKSEQTEIYTITHNLGLSNPAGQMHIVATPMDINTQLIVQSVESNSFTISTWTSNSLDAKQSAFMFIAIYTTDGNSIP